MQRQAQIEQSKHGMRLRAKAIAARGGFEAKIVEVEPILGNEQATVYYHSEERLDFRDVASALQREFGTRIEMRQVGARDEARITADYERCGQYCCCKNFLKVLKPVSMRSAKVQKATLDPLKISGRCGRLMCCLRYEDSTYEELRKKLPRNKSRVGTPDGDGMVIDSQILTQLALVRLDLGDKEIAVPIEDLTPPVSAEAPERPEGREPERGRDGRPRRDDRPPREGRGDREARPGREPRQGGERPAAAPGPKPERVREGGAPEPSRRDGQGGPPERAAEARVAGGGSEINMDDIETDFGDGSSRPAEPGGEQGGGDGEQARRKRRRRRRRGGPGAGGGAPGGSVPGGGGSPG